MDVVLTSRLEMRGIGLAPLSATSASSTGPDESVANKEGLPSSSSKSKFLRRATNVQWLVYGHQYLDQRNCVGGLLSSV